MKQMNSRSVPSIFLVDDHPMVRQGLTSMLGAVGFAVCGQAEDGVGALQDPKLDGCDLVILDLSLGEESGLDFIGRLIERGPAVLVYSMHEGSTLIQRTFQAGAGGYVTKRESSETLLLGIRTVLAGDLFRSPRVEEALRGVAWRDDLTAKQQHLYELLGKGFTNEEICKRLSISQKTLESYYVRIMNKLGLHGTRELRQQAIRAALSAGPSNPVFS